jgi:hypothetical protein
VRIVESGTDQDPCYVVTTALYREGDAWLETPDRAKASAASIGPDDKAWERGDIEIRGVARRQVFIGGKPVGDAFE